MEQVSVSLVVPVRNEEDSLAELFHGIDLQTLAPAEIVIVDGGSTDRTRAIVMKHTLSDPRVRLIETSGATPGKGRNIGIAAAANDWIALTDAGTTIEPDWLERLVQRIASEAETAVVYGNYDPIRNDLFEKIAALSYVAAKHTGEIRGRSTVSCLLHKKAWEKAGGFPDWRAAEDLAFMEALDMNGVVAAKAPAALVHWKLRPDLYSTFIKFVLYSKHNVWAGRQWDWHYGILKQYLLVVPFLVLAALHAWWWLLAIPLWMMARAAKRIVAHRGEIGLAPMFNPLIFFGVVGLIYCIDVATFVGWVRALVGKDETNGDAANN